MRGLREFLRYPSDTFYAGKLLGCRRGSRYVWDVRQGHREDVRRNEKAARGKGFTTKLLEGSHEEGLEFVASHKA